jgi:4-diphosphocytidyl-2-C-methyl-D-erythritol kinase
MLVAMSKNSFRLPAFAKINWFLNVLGKREDGFHEICTAFQTVSLGDYLTFSENDEILLTCDNSEIPTDESNLIFKAALELQETFKIKKGVKIHLEKNIPSPGGLGGGSSDAAIALFGLVKLWNIETKFENIFEIAEKLGSDVPFFLSGGTALGVGRGTNLHKIDEVVEKFLLIVTPNINVSTADAFGRLNAPNLTKNVSKSILKTCFDEAEKLKSSQQTLKNDFEKVIFNIHPEIKRVKDTLLNHKATQVLMSGSGASVFAIFENDETRQATMKALEVEKNWRQFAVATISRNEYREALKQVLTVVSD